MATIHTAGAPEAPPNNLPPRVPRGHRTGWLASLTAIFVSSLIGVTLTVSLAALVFSGDLAAYRAEAIGLALLGGAFVGVIVGVRSSLPGMVATVQDATAAILAVSVSATIASFPPGLDGNALFSTVTVALGATALVTAGILLAFGRFGVGKWVRFLPHPVVGGFLAGTGWLLFVGGLAVMMDVPLGASAVAALVVPETWLRVAPGLALAVALLVLTRNPDRSWVWPGVVLGTVALFYVTMLVFGGTPAGWRDLGLLLGPFPDGDPWRAFATLDFGAVHWPSVARQAPTAIAVSLLAAIGVLLNTTALELITDRKIDLDRELRVAGAANLAAGMVGGLVGYHMLADTVLVHRIGRGMRWEALGVSAVTGLAFLAGAAFLSFFPTLLMGGLLAYLGLAFMHEWLVRTIGKLGRFEYAIIVLIVIVIAFFGFLTGLAVGIGAAVVLFVVDYSRMEVVRHEVSGRAYRSRVTRGADQSALLAEHGDSIRVFELQGYLFFGTANALFERIERRVEDGREVRFVLLDAGGLTGADATALLTFEKLLRLGGRSGFRTAADATALLTFEKLLRLGGRSGFRTAISGLSPQLRRQVEASTLMDDRSGPVEIFVTLDAALEWCENHLLEAFGADRSAPDFDAWMAERWEGPGPAADLLDYFEPATYQEGDVLIREGDPPDTLYFIVSGAVTAEVQREGAPPVRFETMYGGSLIGELGFFAGGARTASVVADEPTIAYRLSVEAHARMVDRDSALAAAFHKLVVRILADRTKHLMRIVGALQR